MKNRLSFILIVATASAAFAHSNATGAVKERMDNMKSIASAMKTLTAIAREATAFDGPLVSETSQQVISHAQDIPALFREKDMSHPTEATEEIWTDWQDFTRLADELALASKSASEAKSASELSAALVGMNRTCRACHETFRLKK